MFATSREVKQKFLVIWEGLEPWCFLFHILFLSPPLSGCINNAKDLVARGAMGDGFAKSPLPEAITSEGKGSQDTSCPPLVPQWQVRGHMWTTSSTSSPVMDHRKISSYVKMWAEDLCKNHRGWNLHSVIMVNSSFTLCTTKEFVISSM